MNRTKALDFRNNELKYWLKVIRPINLIIICLTQFMAAYFLLHQQDIFEVKFLLLVFSTVFIAASGNLINDYYDIKIDFINKPKDVIVGKHLKRRWVLFISVLLSVFGIGLGILISPAIAFINLISAFLLWFYSNQLKRLPFVGNLIIGILTGLSVLVVGVYFDRYENLLFIYALFAFYMTLIREIIKDIEDFSGDKQFGGKTLPIWLGIRKSKNIVFALISIFYINLTILSLRSDNLIIYGIFGLFSLVMIRFTQLTFKADTKRAFRSLSFYAKRIMIFGVLSMMIH
jgi:4-hydroxybenzoate polyprenyltransferase